MCHQRCVVLISWQRLSNNVRTQTFGSSGQSVVTEGLSCVETEVCAFPGTVFSETEDSLYGDITSHQFAVEERQIDLRT